MIWWGPNSLDIEIVKYPNYLLRQLYENQSGKYGTCSLKTQEGSKYGACMCNSQGKNWFSTKFNFIRFLAKEKYRPVKKRDKMDLYTKTCTWMTTILKTSYSLKYEQTIFFCKSANVRFLRFILKWLKNELSI